MVAVEQCTNERLEFVSKQLEEKNSIINSISDALMVLDSKTYEILDVNKSFLEFYGLGEDQVLGRKCYEMTHQLTKPCQEIDNGSCPLENSVKSGNITHVEHVHKNRNGKNLYFEITACPIKERNSEVARIIHLARDITDRRRAEEALRESSEKIKLFAYSIAHDLKNPALGIFGVTKLLQKHYVDSLDERGRKYCMTILKAAEQVDTLVGQINEYISTNELPLSIERTHFKELFRTVKEDFSSQLNRRQVHWSEPEYLPEINADRLSILRAIRNLVDNALKYGGNKLSKIEIGYQDSGDYHVLSVKDDGIGLKEEEHEGLFAAFVRKGTSRGIAGTGIGLTIVKEIAEKHKGKVWLELNRSNGMTFCMSISKNLRAS
jgi:PAS domain S-box-containing protein